MSSDSFADVVSRSTPRYAHPSSCILICCVTSAFAIALLPVCIVPGISVPILALELHGMNLHMKTGRIVPSALSLHAHGLTYHAIITSCPASLRLCLAWDFVHPYGGGTLCKAQEARCCSRVEIDANEAIKFRLLHSGSNASDLTEEVSFAPEMAHQIFGDDEVSPIHLAR